MRKIWLIGLTVMGCGSSEMATPDAATADPAEGILATDLAIDLATKHGTATIQFVGGPDGGASFEVEGLTIQNVRAPAGYAISSDNKTLSVEAPPGVIANVIVDYTYKDYSTFMGSMPMGTTLIWPYYCGNLFPCHSAPADGLRFTMTLTNPPAGQIAVYPSAIPANAP